ncbi:hypothetical protein R0131_13335 [Clostridium sp. AL.422]|uniref:hypothetical protein n=1 Tax=Clostridium TaxID=1485 RepID=UPI00293DD44E|nr:MULTISPECIES: hypothetical protein [unclassified Clostridium]MDV4151805.1 hypothetical protein [Clostridium sp. AL.422]
MVEFLVITDIDTYDEDIGYCGLNEIEAYKNFKTLKIKHRKVNIVKAEVEKILVKNIEFIINYKIIQIIK